MLVHLLAVVAAFLLNAPPPERLDDPARTLSAVVPEGRVLLAENSRGKGAVPSLVQDTLKPALAAESFLAVDVASGRVLAQKEPSAVRPVASLTKLLTALTVVRLKSPEDIVSVSSRAVSAGRHGASAGLVVGEELRISEALAALLVASANDAAVALAESVSASESNFAKEMERTATALNLSRTRTENATGFDNLAHFSTAYDVALLLQAAWTHPVIGTFLRMEEYTVVSVDGMRKHRLRTTNRLLGVRTDVLGGKTGLSDAAGENLAVMAESPDGHLVAAVVLGSRDRFADMENLLNWTFWAYRWS